MTKQSIIMLLTAIASICDGHLDVYMQNAQQPVSSTFAVTVAADATVRDLAQELLQFPAETSGLPKGFITEDAIIINHGGRELVASELLADVGVGAESALSYQTNEYEFDSISVRVNGCRQAVVLNYRIPVAHHDVLGLMAQQTREQYEDSRILDCNVINFNFIFGKKRIKMPDRMKQVKMKHPNNHSRFMVNGTVRVIEKSLLKEGSEFDFDSYNNEDGVGRQFCAKMGVFGNWLNQIGKPVILDKFQMIIQEHIMIFHLSEERQDFDVICQTRPVLSVDVQIPESLTFLFE